MRFCLEVGFVGFILKRINRFCTVRYEWRHNTSCIVYWEGLFPFSQHFEKSNSHIANILIFTPEWSAGYSLFS